MSERIRRLHLKTPFDAKRVIVAGCAAIAMVLGATSVGVNLTPNNRTAGSPEVSSIVNAGEQDNDTSSSLSGTGLSRQHTLEVRNFLQQQSSPMYNAPPVAKPARNALSPIFGTSNPVQFISQMVQLQQQQTQPASSKDTNKPTETTPATSAPDSSSSQPTPADTEGTAEPATTNPADSAEDPSGEDEETPTIMRGDSSSAPVE